VAMEALPPGSLFGLIGVSDCISLVDMSGQGGDVHLREVVVGLETLGTCKLACGISGGTWHLPEDLPWCIVAARAVASCRLTGEQGPVVSDNLPWLKVALCPLFCVDCPGLTTPTSCPPPPRLTFFCTCRSRRPCAAAPACAGVCACAGGPAGHCAPAGSAGACGDSPETPRTGKSHTENPACIRKGVGD
jgi:hypothetical protein